MTYPHNPCPEHDRDPCPECERYGRSWCTVPGDPCWHQCPCPDCSAWRERQREYASQRTQPKPVQQKLL